MSTKGLRKWLLIHRPDQPQKPKLMPLNKNEAGSALYYASYTGLTAAVNLLLDRGANVNEQGGYYGNALQAASYQGNIEICRLLIEKGTNINAPGGYYGNALAAAFRGDIDDRFSRLPSWSGRTKPIQLLIEKGAKDGMA